MTRYEKFKDARAFWLGVARRAPRGMLRTTYVGEARRVHWKMLSAKREHVALMAWRQRCEDRAKTYGEPW